MSTNLNGRTAGRRALAVIGGGVSGVVAAYLLQQRFDVTVFESESRLGGHTSTVVIGEGPDLGLAVDTGFIVLNNKNYPLFHRFLERLRVPVRWSDMSFAFECRNSGQYYAGTGLNGLFARRSNLFSGRYYSFLSEILRFCREGRELLAESQESKESLGEFLVRRGFGEQVTEEYILPMAAAIWSAPNGEVLEFPVVSLLRFFANHGLLAFSDRPRWQTVVGGSAQYLRAFVRQFTGSIRLSAPVRSVHSIEDGQRIVLQSGEELDFDLVVLACHADQSYRLVSDKSELEERLLGVWRYQTNRVILHTDESFLPRKRRAHASWNYIRERELSTKDPVPVTYSMNRLQGFTTEREYCVTLNPVREPEGSRVIQEFYYHHPIYDSASVESQRELPQLNLVGDRLFCGSYFGYGFHEDAVRSAVKVSERFGLSL